MTGLQYAVVYLPNADLTPEAVGPFRSFDRACDAADAIDAATQGRVFNTAPSVVVLRSLPEVLANFAGDDW